MIEAGLTGSGSASYSALRTCGRAGSHKGAEAMPAIYNSYKPNHTPKRVVRMAAVLEQEITLFLEKHPHLDEGKFGCLSCGNYYIIRRIRAGKRVMPKTEYAIRQFMLRYRGPLECG